MKKIKLITILLLAIFVFVGCTKEVNESNENENQISDDVENNINEFENNSIASDIVKPDNNIQIVE